MAHNPGGEGMSGISGHPQRETKIRQWVNKLEPGQTFRSTDIAKSLNLTPVEVGNQLKAIDNVQISHRIGTKVVWGKI
jgi:hypothetical protein